MMHPLDSPQLSQRYFFPRAQPPPGAHAVEVNGLQCAQVIVDPHAPTLIYFHGNGEVVADSFPEPAALFSAMGWNLFFAEYRGYGGSVGTPALVSMLDDVGPLVDASGGDPARTVVFGRSVGSIYALEAVAQRPALAGLVLESGVHDVLERLLVRIEPAELGLSRDALSALVLERFDHAAKIAHFAGKLLVLHALGDHLVGVHHARANFAAASPANASMTLFPHGDHNTIFGANAAAYLDALKRFLDATVAP